VQATEEIKMYGNEYVRSLAQGEATHRKDKRFKLGGQAYDRSSE
jgi:hypothetical protein